MQGQVEAVTLQVSLLVVRVKALLVWVLFLVILKVVMMLEEVLLVASLSLFTSPSTLTPTTRPCGACLTQNISKARAGDPDRLSRGERTNWGGNLPVARCLFLLARHLEGGRTITLCYSDRGCLFPFTRYRPPRDGRHVSVLSLKRHVGPMTCPGLLIASHDMSSGVGRHLVVKSSPRLSCSRVASTLVRNSPPLGIYSRTMPIALGGAKGGGRGAPVWLRVCARYPCRVEGEDLHVGDADEAREHGELEGVPALHAYSLHHLEHSGCEPSKKDRCKAT